MCCVGVKTSVLLQTAKTTVYKIDNPERTRVVRIIFDSGSQRSYITDRVRHHLSLEPIHTETMVIKTFGSKNQTKQACDVVRVGNRSSLELSFLSVPLICEPLSNQPIALATNSYAKLASLELADYAYGDEALEIDMLVGSDQLLERLLTSTMALQLSTLDWAGYYLDQSHQASSVNLISTHVLAVDVYQPQEEKQDLDSQLKKFWDLESMGINPEECSVYDEFEKEIIYKNNRYEIALPWKQSHPSLPDNYELALRRLNGLLRRLKQMPHILNQYDSVIRDQLKRGIVEVVDQSEVTPYIQTHYLSHHAVLREDKATTKLRIVYDASAKTCGPSLNDCLYTGPKFGLSIMEIILRFRAFSVALAADIEKAFLMVGVSPRDRDVLRFLWIDDVENEVPKITVLRFT